MTTQEQDVSPRVARLIEDLRAALTEMQERPEDHIPAYNCGVIYGTLGDHASAARSYRAALERNPKFFQGYYNLGMALAALDLWQEAESAFRQGLLYNDKDGEAWGNLGVVYQRLNRPDDALESYKKAVAIDPKDAQSRVRMGLICYDRGELTRARELFEAAVDANSEDPEAWNYLGLTHFHQGRLDDARNCYLKAIQVNDRYAQAWNNLGNVFARQGDLSTAEKAYRDASTRDPEDADIWFNLGELFLRRKHPECERCLWRVVEKRPEDFEAWELLRQWFHVRPNYPHWRRALEALLGNRPGNIELRRELAAVLDQMNDYPAALDQLRLVLAADAHDDASHLSSARLNLKLNQVGEAFSALSKARITDGPVLDLWKHIGERALHHGQGERAETCFMTVVAHQSYRTELWQMLGDLAMARKEWDIAYERYCKAAEMNRNQEDVWWPMAERFLALGNAPRAADCLEHLAEALAMLPGEWPKAFAVYRSAGREIQFLERLEAELARELLPRRLWTELARMYDEAGKRERAAACLKHLDPELEKVEQFFLLARQHLERQEPGQALAHLKRLEALRKNDPAFWLLLGDAHYQAGNINEARQAYERAVALDGKEFRAWFRLGNLRFRARQLDKAREAFLRATALNGNEPKGWYNLGCVQTEEGSLADARASFERALKLDRRFDQAWNWLGIVFVNLREPELARRCYVRCVAINRGSATGWANLAALYKALERTKDAALCQQRADALGGGAPVPAAPVRLFHDRGRI